MVEAAVVAALARLRFRVSDTAFELAVPADVPLGDLLPAILSYAGDQAEEEGAEHGGWVLQRLGGEPLDEERSADALSLRDGETLYLRHRYDAMPAVHFDDMVDGVASGMNDRGDGWRPEITHNVALAFAGVALAAGWMLLAVPGPHRERGVAAALAAVILLLGALSASRAVGDAVAGTAIGAAAVPYLALAGTLLPAPGADLTAARLLAGGSAAAGAAVLALAAVGCSAPLFLGLVLLSLLAMSGGVLGLAGMPVSQGAALSALLAVICGAFAPGLSFRLSGLRLPALPRNADELQEEIDPLPAGEVLGRTTVADGYLSVFYAVTGATCAASMTAVGWHSSGWGPPTFVGDLCLLLLFHARAIGSVRQRMSVLVPAVYGIGLLLTDQARTLTPGARLMDLAVLFALAAALAVAAWTLPGRRLLPYWGRIGDVLHSLSAWGLAPLAAQVLGVFHAARGIAG